MINKKIKHSSLGKKYKHIPMGFMIRSEKGTPAKSIKAEMMTQVSLFLSRQSCGCESHRPQTAQELDQPNSSRLRNLDSQRT